MSDPDYIDVDAADVEEDFHGIDPIEDESAELEDGNLSKAMKRGRRTSDLWSLFTNDPNPQKLKSAVCKHCKIVINYHKKSEYAKTHLNKCSAFRKVVHGMEFNDRPSWYVSNKRPAARSQELEAASMLVVSSKGQSSKSQSSKGQSSIMSHMLPSVTRQQKEKFQYHMAMHYYATGTSFQRIEDEHLKKAISILRPDQNLLPDRKKLATSLLDECYDDIKKRVHSHLANSNSMACLVSDAWSNIKNDPIVNYMATSPKVTMFLESVSTGQQGHNANWIATDITRVIRAYPLVRFAGAVTDNTMANKSAWAKLSLEFPMCYFQGCCSHGLHLLVKDIFAATKTKKPGALENTFPEGYPFESMLWFINDCKDVVKFFHNHHAVKAQLQEAQAAAGLRALAKAAPTRWGTIQAMCQSILDSERQLHTIVSARNFVTGTAAQKAERERIKTIISNRNFVDQLEKCLIILKPIDTLIVKYQSDNVAISEVFPDFHALPEKFKKMFDNHNITESELGYLVKLSQQRFQFMYGTAHGLAYLLDPRFLGDGLPQQQRRALEETLISTPIADDGTISEQTKEELYTQFTAFFILASQDKNMNSFRYKFLVNRRKTPLEYWLTDGTEWPVLQKVAIRVFSMATSSAASERKFSTFGFIHSKLRNSLRAKSVEKLVYIKSNMSSLSGDCTNNCTDTESEEEEEFGID